MRNDQGLKRKGKTWFIPKEMKGAGGVPATADEFSGESNPQAVARGEDG
jgi:hypothetical protein